MSKNIVYNISYGSYLSLISNIESKFNSYKEKLLEKNIKISHPSLLTPLSQIDLNTLSKLYPKESKIFGTTSNFYNCLVVVNYHLGSVLQLSEILTIKDINSVSISIEEILIIESFKSL